MSIYLDAVWLLNFFFDFSLLLVTNRLAKLNAKRLRLALAAFIASAFVPITILYPESFFTSIFAKVLFSFVIIITAFGIERIQRLIKLLFLFHFVTFSIGGAMIAIHFLMQEPFSKASNGVLMSQTDFGSPLSWLFVLVGFPLSLLFTKSRMDKHTQDSIRYDSLYTVEITIQGKAYQTEGYVDSGNQLVDMFTKKPVIICDEPFLSVWFENRDWEQLKQAYETGDLDNIPSAWLDYLQIVPYQGVEGKNGFIFAIKPDSLCIIYEEEQIETTHFLVGIQFGNLTADGRYHCLLQPELIQGHRAYSA